MPKNQNAEEMVENHVADATVRDRLWELAFKSYYQVSFEELLSTTMLRRWSRLDFTLKILVALTASGSALSGWQMLQQDKFKLVWLILAGVAALLADISPWLKVSDRLETWGEARRAYAALVHDLERLRNSMRVNPEFSIPEATKTLDEFQATYKTADLQFGSDWLVTRRRLVQVQRELDHHLHNEIGEVAAS